jgi:hypothetical protein
MPKSVIQQIKCKICPPPLGPEVANAQLVAVNDTIQQQANVIEQLEKHVIDLEKRYKINFTIGNVKSGPNTKPGINVSGDLSNVVLDFTTNTPNQGAIGDKGPQGPPGLDGPSGIKGNSGYAGYWGNII